MAASLWKQISTDASLVFLCPRNRRISARCISTINSSPNRWMQKRERLILALDYSTQTSESSPLSTSPSLEQSGDGSREFSYAGCRARSIRQIFSCWHFWQTFHCFQLGRLAGFFPKHFAWPSFSVLRPTSAPKRFIGIGSGSRGGFQRADMVSSADWGYLFHERSTLRFALDRQSRDWPICGRVAATTRLSCTLPGSTSALASAGSRAAGRNPAEIGSEPIFQPGI